MNDLQTFRCCNINEQSTSVLCEVK